MMNTSSSESLGKCVGGSHQRLQGADVDETLSLSSSSEGCVNQKGGYNLERDQVDRIGMVSVQSEEGLMVGYLKSKNK